MTNDKDGAALLREAETRDGAVQFLENAARNWRRLPPLSNDDLDDVATALTHYRRAALKSHGQAFDAAGVTQWMRSQGYAQVQITLRSDGGHEIDCRKSPLMIRRPDGSVAPLAIPEAPASVEPVAWMYTHANGVREISDKRDDYMAAQSPPDGEWTETPLYARPEPDTIGSNFGNGGGFDPVDDGAKAVSIFDIPMTPIRNQKDHDHE